jgi:PleD family two-component response regulator
MDHLLKEEVARCQRYGSFSSLIMLDLDNFKRVNDTFGHPAGDQVLRQVGQLLRNHVRSMDRPIRYGGEELAVVLPETTDSGAFVVAERIRHAIAAERFVDMSGGDAEAGETARDGGDGGDRGEDHLPMNVTVSLGVACLPSDAGSARALVAAADQALYAAKSQGRNRTVLFSKNPLRTSILDKDHVDVTAGEEAVEAHKDE